jgi:hypothetical protein
MEKKSLSLVWRRGSPRVRPFVLCPWRSGVKEKGWGWQTWLCKEPWAVTVTNLVLWLLMPYPSHECVLLQTSSLLEAPHLNPGTMAIKSSWISEETNFKPKRKSSFPGPKARQQQSEKRPSIQTQSSHYTVRPNLLKARNIKVRVNDLPRTFHFLALKVPYPGSLLSPWKTGTVAQWSE